jgi:UDP-N-acetylmuramoyl-tripeptide--D-alanyl-D-alanine ligase
MTDLLNTTLSELFVWLGAKQAATLRGEPSTRISGICTDSRNLQPGQLFVAIVGESFDAHDFLAEVQKLASAVIISRPVTGLRIPSILVSDTKMALGEIALGYRSQFSLPLIAVAGSNGKTTVKEMIAAVLAQSVGADARLSTQGNLNNDLGVPFTLFRLNQHHRFGVVEMGMNHPGEMAAIAAMTQASVALVNNAQREHQEFMASVEATAIENGTVISALSADGVAVFPYDDACVSVWRDLAEQRKRFEFGLGQYPKEDANYVFASEQSQPDAFSLSVKRHRVADIESISVSIQIDGQHNVRNALAASACCLAAGIDLKTIALGLANFAPAKGRLVRHDLGNGVLLIDDSYNANPDSVRAAIDILAHRPSPRILILGDMGEVGSQGPEFHREVGEFAKERGLHHVLLLGAATSETALGAGAIAEHFQSVDALLKRAEQIVHAPATVLVKGSRFMKMERVVAALTEARHAA